MKTIFTILLLALTTLVVSAQPKQAPKPPPAPRPAAPKGPIPYVLKKDYDESMAAMTSKINSVAGSTSGIRHEINAKDAKVNELDQKILKVEEILNSTAFKVATTSDSLNQTRFSVEEYMKQNDSRIDLMKAESAKTMQMVWIVLGIAIVLPLLVFGIMFGRINGLKKVIESQARAIENKLEESLTKNSELIQSESKNQQFYTDRASSIVRNEMSKNLKSEMDLIGREMANINREIQTLNNKIESQENPEA